eukprot:scaffold143102_cov29-Prasinocladus_malaysianus.AAC.1
MQSLFTSIADNPHPRHLCFDYGKFLLCAPANDCIALPAVLSSLLRWCFGSYHNVDTSCAGCRVIGVVLA